MSDVATPTATKSVGEGQGPGTGPARTPTSASTGAFQITGLADPQRNRYLKMLTYGPPGAGKTTLFGSAVDVPSMCDVLFVSIEGGELALEDNDRIQNSAGIDVIRMTDIDQLKKLLEFMKIHCQLRDANNEEKLRKLQAQVFGVPEDQIDRVRKYRTLVIDSLTEIEGKNLAKIMGLDSKDTSAFEVGQIEVSGWGEFRQNNHTIQRIVRAYRDLPIHLMLVCAQSYSQDEMKRFHYGPALTGKLSSQIQGFVDIVSYLVISGAAAEAAGIQDAANAQVRRLYIQPQAGVKFDAKNRRSSYKKPYFDNPVMLDIMSGLGLVK